jgi:selenobiotic family peptide radical SAM maturase
MLTLTQANIGQVIPLAQMLQGLADRLTFNRLSQVGQAAQIAPASRHEYESFLRDYLAASRSTPILGFKDNLFNILRHRSGRPLLRGCTGFGCGAAFNFVALLPDGEVHACRKFPSRIGHLRECGLDEIYRSRAAQRFRRGCAGCLRCPIRNACGGCLAVAYGHGLDILRQCDPYCFMDRSPMDRQKGGPVQLTTRR